MSIFSVKSTLSKTTNIVETDLVKAPVRNFVSTVKSIKSFYLPPISVALSNVANHRHICEFLAIV